VEKMRYRCGINEVQMWKKMHRVSHGDVEKMRYRCGKNEVQMWKKMYCCGIKYGN